MPLTNSLTHNQVVEIVKPRYQGHHPMTHLLTRSLLRRVMVLTSVVDLEASQRGMGLFQFCERTIYLNQDPRPTVHSIFWMTVITNDL